MAGSRLTRIRLFIEFIERPKSAAVLFDWIFVMKSRSRPWLNPIRHLAKETTLRAISCLGECEGVGTLELARRVKRDGNALSQTMQQLERDGLVQRTLTRNRATESRVSTHRYGTFVC